MKRLNRSCQNLERISGRRKEDFINSSCGHTQYHTVRHTLLHGNLSGAKQTEDPSKSNLILLNYRELSIEK
jgi:hypothetical protein